MGRYVTHVPGHRNRQFGAPLALTRKALGMVATVRMRGPASGGLAHHGLRSFSDLRIARFIASASKLPVSW